MQHDPLELLEELESIDLEPKPIENLAEIEAGLRRPRSKRQETETRVEVRDGQEFTVYVLPEKKTRKRTR